MARRCCAPSRTRSACSGRLVDRLVVTPACCGPVPRGAAWYRARSVQTEAALEAASHGELCARVAASGRDLAAEAELCRRFAPRVRLYGLKHLRDEDRARDLVQVVLVAMIEALRAGRIEDPERFDRFVLGMARNCALRLRAGDTRAVPTEPAELDVGEYLPNQDALDLEALMRCLGQLEVRARTILQLSFYRDKSADEIAGVLAMTAGNVRVVRHRAVAQLRVVAYWARGRVTCRAPSDDARLVAYWANDLSPDEQATVEEHLFACDGCFTAAERIAKVAQAFRTSLPPIISSADLAGLRAQGARLVENTFVAGQRQPVVFAPGIDMLIHHLGGLDLADAERVEVIVRNESGAVVMT